MYGVSGKHHRDRQFFPRKLPKMKLWQHGGCVGSYLRIDLVGKVNHRHRPMDKRQTPENLLSVPSLILASGNSWLPGRLFPPTRKFHCDFSHLESYPQTGLIVQLT